jgi:hypothetical protein
MSESLVGLIDPATRHAVVVIAGAGACAVPAGTTAAAVIVVSFSFRFARLSQVAAAALRDETAAAPSNNTHAALPRSFMIFLVDKAE